MTAPVVEVSGLVVRYGTATALDRVALTVGAAEAVALIGPNGAGKTSLVNAVMGVLRPAAGRVRVRGRAALVPEGRQMFDALTVEDNLALGAWRRRRERGARDTARVYEVLPRLAALRDRRAGSLSGGEQQMVAFGRALMADPDVLVVDELSLGLAPLVTADLAEHLRALNTGRGLALLLIEQNARLALDLCTRGYVLEAGRIRAEGAAAELAAGSAVADAYLGGAASPAGEEKA
ncbi:ABC transporter ATP-binding protein [Actinomadura sp. WAC 06369]|uniref:ABC transporter ATP-binding protein n=1 Tax=Actinomadura sp. WAC 06369 TaxID=2203193 RepID=UPI000F7B3688|nr:ATP-binding cassette domain-containing protein [Actinomadura sp. WAC 06369]RSN67110.1 ABC transporter ATP-binding protein [Actinomadura sp. WAC 06369]